MRREWDGVEKRGWEILTPKHQDWHLCIASAWPAHLPTYEYLPTCECTALDIPIRPHTLHSLLPPCPV
ncbi:hypothetical protein LX32DRAFT_454022 [Colletotrichum zoysiae]|uniref:Uncharacterized protein n=1 Tax=Colletotrichum zoysiae TaxID=1216348 RepID=A0AAD9HFQ1_9PEZI|nr:hypothetical protein LX32DRAFT_454022 [Colletotrichum zoysiae]